MYAESKPETLFLPSISTNPSPKADWHVLERAPSTTNITTNSSSSYRRRDSSISPRIPVQRTTRRWTRCTSTRRSWMPLPRRTSTSVVRCCGMFAPIIGSSESTHRMRGSFSSHPVTGWLGVTFSRPPAVRGCTTSTSSVGRLWLWAWAKLKVLNWIRFFFGNRWLRHPVSPADEILTDRSGEETLPTAINRRAERLPFEYDFVSDSAGTVRAIGFRVPEQAGGLPEQVLQTAGRTDR